MKLSRNQFRLNAKSKSALALCTVIAFSAMAFGADDKDKTAPARDRDAATGTSKATQLSRSDQSFLKDACRGGHMEVQMGNLGVQKAQSEQLKTFAQKLIDDHTKANAELKQLATSKVLTLPEPSDKIAGANDSDKIEVANDTDRRRVREKDDGEELGRKAHAELKKLESLSGTDFAKAFAKMAVSDHEKDVKEFEKASQKADDADVRAFAAKTLPTLREHLQQAKSLQASVGEK